MGQATQFCIGMEDKPGVFAKLCAALGEANVSIDALFVTNDADGCWVNMVATPTSQADRALTEGGYHFFKEKVLILEGENQPGVLEQVTIKLAEAGVNINYVYGADTPSSRFVLVLNVSDLDAASKALAT